MQKTSTITLAFLLIICAALSVFATVKADTASMVTVNNPTNQNLYGNKGVTSGGYWVGQIPMTITSGSTSVLSLGYCMDFDRTIVIGTTYPASLSAVGDTVEWRAVSYVLTWSNPSVDSDGAAAQIAVWRLLNQTRGTDYYVESWLNPSLDSAGNAVANQAWGKDVVRQGDQFRWVSPITGNMTSIQASPGQNVTFTAKLTDAAGTPRANVRILFNATLNINTHVTLLNSTYVSTSAAYTDRQGQVQVTVTVPMDARVGSSVGVEAATQSVWPQQFVDTTDPSIQDLIATGDTFQLTVSTNMTIYGFITVLPESPVGPLAAVGAFGGGFIAFIKIKQHKKAVKE
jgi:hypothetical protein